MALSLAVVTSASWQRLCDLSVCHSVNRITDECRNGCRPNLAAMGKDHMASRVDSGSLFHFFHHCKIGDFFRHLLAFLIQLTADLYHTWQNDWRRQDNASTTFPGTDPTDICIWINLKIWITSRSLSVKLWHWQRFVLSGCSCLLCMEDLFQQLCASQCKILPVGKWVCDGVEFSVPGSARVYQLVGEFVMALSSVCQAVQDSTSW